MVSGTKFLNCSTGDCGSALTCAVNGDPPLTLAEFTLNGSNNLDYYDISIIDGFNIPMG
ncbi:thaumatin-like protein, partial [Trifolium medium]|nr:thaumatin-like protein [Trifolium medium]